MDFCDVSTVIDKDGYTSEKIFEIVGVPKFEKGRTYDGSQFLETAIGLGRLISGIHGVEIHPHEAKLKSADSVYEENPFLPTIGVELEIRGKQIPFAVGGFFKVIGWPIEGLNSGDLVTYVEISPPPGYSPLAVNQLLSSFLRLGFVECAKNDHRKIMSIEEDPIPSLHVNLGIARQVLDKSDRKTPLGLYITEIGPLISSIDQLLHGNVDRLCQKKINKDAKLIKSEWRSISIVKETDTGELVPYDSRMEYSMPGFYDYRTYRSVMNIYELHALLMSVDMDLLPHNEWRELLNEADRFLNNIRGTSFGGELMDNLDPSEDPMMGRKDLLLDYMDDLEQRRQIYSIVHDFKRRARHLIGLPSVR